MAIRDRKRLTKSTTITVTPIEKGRISVETQKQYRWQLEAFKKYLGLTNKGDEELYTRLSSQSRVAVERKIIEYLDDYLTKKNHLNFASVNTAKAAILRFCIMNDILLNREKIGMSLSLGRNSLSIEIWNHFYETHFVDLDATQVFIDYLSKER